MPQTGMTMDRTRDVDGGTIWIKVSKLGTALGVTPIKGKVWNHQVDDVWRLVCNGSDKAVDVDGVQVPYGCLYVTFNGWPAGQLWPVESVPSWFAAGAAANVQAFVAALDAAIVAAGGGK